VRRFMRKAFKIGEGIHESRVRHKDGHYIWFEIKVKLFKDENGNQKYLFISRNIDERKRAEQALRESEEKYRLISENANDLIGVLNKKFEYEYLNEETFLQTLGYEKDDLIGECALDYIHPEDVNSAANRLKKGFESGHGSAEVRFKHKKGHWVWIEAKGKIFIDNNGEEKALIISRNITERKRTQKLLKASKERYRHLFEKSPNKILLLDYSGIFLEVNTPFLEYFGYKREDLIGKDFREIKNFSSKSISLYKTIYNGVLAKGFFDPIEFQVGDKNDIKKWMEIRASVIEVEGINIIQVIIQDVDERKKIELALKESEEKFRTITEESQMGIAVLQDDVIKYVNERMANMYGYSVEEILSWKALEFLKLFSPEEYDFLLKQARIKQQNLDNAIQRYQIRAINKSGEKFWVDNFSKTINYDGKPADLVTQIDITQKIKAEQKLKNSEKKYRHLFENSSYGIILFDLQGNVIDCNKIIEKIFITHNKEEFIGKNILGFVKLKNDEKVDIVKNMFKNVADEKKAQEIVELELIRRSGDKFWILIHTSLLKIENQIVIQSIIQDITENKKAEQALKESEEKYRTLFEEANDAIYLLEESRIIECNEKTLRMFGFENKYEIIGLPIWKLSPPTQPDGSSSKAMAIKIRKETKDGKSKRFYWKHLKKNGIPFDAEVSLSPVPYGNKIISQAIVRDITKIKEIERELRNLNKLKSELLTRMSHELKTPMMAIKGYVELLLLKNKEQLNKNAMFLIEEIKKGAIRLEELIEAILKTADLETGSMELNKSKNDLSSLIKRCVKELEAFTKLRNHHVSKLIQEDIYTNFDHDQMHHVINNLLVNAIKYTPPNGNIEIRTETKQNEIIISIEDSGIGFTEDEINQVFKKFGKIERFGQGYDVVTEGSGLGLYISKKIVELHGGKIWFKSEGRNKGTIFYFSLPLSNS
ncbi:MAG: PAS domain S-box protein, partial [Promethearchaeota archaeon]